MQLVHEYLAHLVGAYLVELVDRAHYLAGLLLHARKPVKAVQNLAVIDLYLELFKTKLCKGAVNYRRYLGFVYDIQLTVADDIDISLVKLTEPATLGTLATVDLADLIAAEREGQAAVVCGNILRKRHGEVKAQCKVGIALGKAVFRFRRRPLQAAPRQTLSPECPAA